MTITDFDFICQILKTRSGLLLTNDKAYLLESRLLPVARKWKLATFDDLVRLIRTKNDEAVIRDVVEAMTTNESFFFRDTKPFDQFKQICLPAMLKARASSKTIRIWSAACSSGQEGYSLAMILSEMGAQFAGWKIEIIGTDLSGEILQRAKDGLYSQFEVQRGLPITLLVKYFQQQGDKWQISPEIRAMVQYRNFNLLHEFAGLGGFDVVFCRNVLIYLQAPLQERLMKTFHYALNPAGLLFLGRSEAVHGNEEHFESLDRGAHLFRRSTTTARLPGSHAEREPSARSRIKASRPTLDDVVLRAMAQRFAPAAVLVDAAGDVRHFKGDLSGLMSLPDGRPGFQLMTLLRRELRPELARLIRKLREQDASRERPAPGASGPATPSAVLGRWRNSRAISPDMAVRLSVQSISEDLEAPMLLVCFERRPLDELASPAATGDGDDALVHGAGALEEELATTREHLYTVIEELETSNEESQSTNEELEASNEELQASNDELTTVNEELQVKSLVWLALRTEL